MFHGNFLRLVTQFIKVAIQSRIFETIDQMETYLSDLIQGPDEKPLLMDLAVRDLLRLGEPMVFETIPKGPTVGQVRSLVEGLTIEGLYKKVSSVESPEAKFLLETIRSRMPWLPN